MQSQPAESLQYQTTQLPVANDWVITLTTDRVTTATNDPVTTSNALDDLVTSHNRPSCRSSTELHQSSKLLASTVTDESSRVQTIESPQSQTAESPQS